MKMSRTPLRFCAKSLSWCIGRQSRLASAPSTMSSASRRSRARAARRPASRCRAVSSSRAPSRRPSGSRSPCSVSVPTHSPRWFTYSTSISQKRPRAELGLLGRADGAQHLPGAQAVAGPHRLAEHDRVVGHHRLGQRRASPSGRSAPGAAARRSVRPGAQWCGRNQTEIIVGGAIEPPVISARGLLVPEERVAVLDRRAAS